MKKRRLYYLLIAFFAIGFVGCVNDDNDDPKPPKPGEDTYAVFTIHDTSGRTRAKGELEATEKESNINSPLSILIYDKDGTLDARYDTITLKKNSTNKYTTYAIKMKSGDKYVYIFSLNPKITIATGTNRAEFEKQAISAGYTQAHYTNGSHLPANLATDNNFLIGTLWGQTIDIPAGGTPTAPKQITSPIEMGRAAAKVYFNSVQKEKNPGESPLKGIFDTTRATYRLCSVPIKTYLVGQYETGKGIPGKDGEGILVTSIVHDEPHGTSSSPNGNFTNYTWTGAKTVAGGIADHSYYSVENTTGEDPQGYQYYGNTTYVQLKITYTPDKSETYDGNRQPATTQLNKGETFYAAYIPNRGIMIFNENTIFYEDGTQVPAEEITVYKNGVMHYSIPIKDENESDPVLAHTVLRNHYYKLDVVAINHLGDGSEEPVEPPTPIGKDTYVEANINVIDWTEISMGGIVL